MDSDDYLDNNYLFELYNKANKYNLDILYFEEEQFYDNINLTNQNISKKHFFTSIFNTNIF